MGQTKVFTFSIDVENDQEIVKWLESGKWRRAGGGETHNRSQALRDAIFLHINEDRFAKLDEAVRILTEIWDHLKSIEIATMRPDLTTEMEEVEEEIDPDVVGNLVGIGV
jgi:hypothetical protein